MDRLCYPSAKARSCQGGARGEICMRNIFIVGLTGLTLCGRATDPSVYRQASLNCQAVGSGDRHG